VADVREERRLGPIDRGQRLGTPPFLVVDPRVGEARGNLPDKQREERAVAVVERAVGIEPDDEGR